MLFDAYIFINILMYFYSRGKEIFEKNVEPVAVKKEEMEEEKEFEEIEKKKKEKKKLLRSRGVKRTRPRSTVTSGKFSAGPSARRNNLLTLVETEKIPEKIIGSTTHRGHLIFLMKWRGTEETEIISATAANLMCPQIVIKYYEERLGWMN